MTTTIEARFEEAKKIAFEREGIDFIKVNLLSHKSKNILDTYYTGRQFDKGDKTYYQIYFFGTTMTGNKIWTSKKMKQYFFTCQSLPNGLSSFGTFEYIPENEIEFS